MSLIISPITAERMSICALAAYETRDKNALELLKSRDAGFMEAVSVYAYNAQAYVIEHMFFRAVAFRGTDEKKDWRDNLDLVPLDYWARGFDHNARVVQHRLMTILREMRDKYGEKPFFITGHSLGGAAATVLGLTYHSEAFDFLWNIDKLKGIITFGAPRCMTKKGVKWAYSANLIFRFRHCNDIVPRIPKGYKHPACQLIYIDRRDRICFDSKWRYRLQDRLSDFCVTHLVSDHHMAQYDRAIQKWDTKPW